MNLQPSIVACAMYLIDISISGVLLFQTSAYSDGFWVDRHYFRGVLTAMDFEWTVIISGGHFQFLFRILRFFETSTCSHPFCQRNWLICHTSCSHSFLKSSVFYYKIAVVAIYSFKFTVFLQKWKFQQRGIIVSNLITNFDIFLVAGMYVFKD